MLKALFSKEKKEIQKDKKEGLALTKDQKVHSKNKTCKIHTKNQKDVKPAHLVSGREGEEKAWEYLKNKGFILLEKNWASHPHEIDLICIHLDTIVFIEVKSRKSHDKNAPIAAFNYKKQAHILNAAKKYLTQKNLWHKPCRFDLICIYHEHKHVEHFENVIEQEFTPSQNYRGKNGRSLHNSNTSWQPW